MLFAARLMPPVGGGIERLSEDVLHALRRDFEVVDLSNRGPRWTQLPYLATVGNRLRRRACKLERVVADGGDATLAPALARSGAPSIVRVQGLDLRLPNPVYQRVVRKYLPKAAAICPCSGPTAALLDGFGIPPERIHVVHPAAESPPGWRPSPQPGRILFVGRLVQRKGLAEFIAHVWPGIVREAPNAQLRVVGDGPERPRIERAARAAPGSDHIHLLGALPRDALEREFQAADVLVMPNRPREGDFEGFGIVAIEAAVRGVPVVATRVDGIPDAVLDGQTGILTSPDDPGEMARAVLATIDKGARRDPERLMKLAVSRWGHERLQAMYGALVRKVAWEVEA